MGTSRGQDAPSEDSYRAFIRDAASVLDVNTELNDVVPALIEKPFDVHAQRRVVELLSSERQSAANEAARRIIGPHKLASSA